MAVMDTDRQIDGFIARWAKSSRADRANFQMFAFEIYDTPATQFVASFFGTPTMNFIEGIIDTAFGRAVFRDEGLEVALPASSPSSSTVRTVVLGVRSEHVLIREAGTFSGTARLIEPLGDATLVHFEAHSGRSLVAKIAPGRTISPESALKFDFDAATQRRLNWRDRLTASEQFGCVLDGLWTLMAGNRRSGHAQQYHR